MGKKKEPTMDKKKKRKNLFGIFFLFIEALEKMKNCDLNKECKIEK